jgi:osmotically-inducible protein OsmY
MIVFSETDVSTPSRGLDDDVSQAVEAALAGSPFVSVRGLSCTVREGMLFLRGRVPTFYTRQVALRIVQRMPGVDAVMDGIEVGEPFQDEH